MKKHILSVFSQNKPGVLSRIAGLLRRKLFQIDSLTVGRTSNPKVSRFTIVVEGGVEDAHKTAQALEKLVEVLSVQILPETSVVREIVLARFQVENEREEKFLHEAESDIFAREVLRKGDEVVMELIDSSSKLENFLERVQGANIRILDWVRSGVIALEA